MQVLLQSWSCFSNTAFLILFLTIQLFYTIKSYKLLTNKQRLNNTGAEDLEQSAWHGSRQTENKGMVTKGLINALAAPTAILRLKGAEIQESGAFRQPVSKLVQLFTTSMRKSLSFYVSWWCSGAWGRRQSRVPAGSLTLCRFSKTITNIPKNGWIHSGAAALLESTI